MMRRKILFVSMAFLFAVSPASWAENAPSGTASETCEEGVAERVAALIQSHYETVGDLRADFEQWSDSVVLAGASLGAAAPTRGEVVFAKPGRMRWTYREPAESLLVSDGKVLWIYDVAARQASRLPVEQGYLAGAALQFLLGDGKLGESFDILAKRCGPDEVDLELLPLKPASYEKLGLSASPKTGEIRDSVIVDLFGNRTRIRFSKMQTNLSPPDETFHFEPPKGVEVVELAAPR